MNAAQQRASSHSCSRSVNEHFKKILKILMTTVVTYFASSAKNQLVLTTFVPK